MVSRRVTTIPLFFFVTGRNARAGVFGPVAARIGAAVWPWLTLATTCAYVVVAVLAQLRLNVIATLI